MLTLRTPPKARAKSVIPMSGQAQLELPWERKMPYRGEAEGQRSEVGDKLVLRHHKRQACFLPPKDVSCKRLSLWKPGCWGGRQAADTQLSCTPRRWEHSGEHRRQTEMLWDRWVHGPEQQRNNRFKIQYSTSPGGQQTCLGLERGNQTLWSIVTETAVLQPPRPSAGPRRRAFKRVQAPKQSRNKAALRALLANSCEGALNK